MAHNTPWRTKAHESQKTELCLSTCCRYAHFGAALGFLMHIRDRLVGAEAAYAKERGVLDTIPGLLDVVDYYRRMDLFG